MQQNKTGNTALSPDLSNTPVTPVTRKIWAGAGASAKIAWPALSPDLSNTPVTPVTRGIWAGAGASAKIP